MAHRHVIVGDMWGHQGELVGELWAGKATQKDVVTPSAPKQNI